MCNNINANCLLCNETSNVDGLYSLHGIFNSMKCKQNNDGEYLTKEFSVVIILNSIGSDNDSPFGRRFDLRLTLVNRETKGAIKLIDYSYDPNKNMISANGKGQCKDFSLIRLIVDVEPFVLAEGTGEYILKLWLKDKDDPDGWKVQTMQLVDFEKAEDNE